MSQRETKHFEHGEFKGFIVDFLNQTRVAVMYAITGKASYLCFQTNVLKGENLVFLFKIKVFNFEIL